METAKTTEVQPSSQASHESQVHKPNNQCAEASIADSGPTASSNDNRKVSHEDIELVQNLIERCLQLYMNRGEVVRTLSNRARIEPGFTTLVWQKLEEENADFFRAYYIRLKLKKQIILFNHLLQHQCQLMKHPVPPKVPLVSMQNGIHPMPVNHVPIGYPVLQQPPMSPASQSHLDSIGLSSCHVVNGIPASGNYHPMRMNTEEIVMDNAPSDATPATPPSTAMPSVSEMAVSPTSVASSNHFPFMPTEMSGMGMDKSGLDTTFGSNVGCNGGLQLGPDGGVGSFRDSMKSLGEFWNFSFSDLTADLTNMGDLGPLGDYTGSPFLPSDSDILLDSPDQDDIVEEYFADTINAPCSQSDEDKP